MTTGLVVFITVVIMNVGGLSLDLVLSLLSQTTVTQMIRNGDWWLGTGIIALQLVGALGLAYHFWGKGSV